jgi:hypothetical protein
LWNFSFQEATEIRLKAVASNSRLACAADSVTLRCDTVTFRINVASLCSSIQQIEVNSSWAGGTLVELLRCDIDWIV